MIGGKLIFAGGILIGALAAGPIGYIAGDLLGGWEAAAQAEQRAELVKAQSERDAAQKDLAASKLAEARMAAVVEEKQKAAAEAEKRLGEYEQDLAARGSAQRCLATDADPRWLPGARRPDRKPVAPDAPGKPGDRGADRVPRNPQG